MMKTNWVSALLSFLIAVSPAQAGRISHGTTELTAVPRSDFTLSDYYFTGAVDIGYFGYIIPPLTVGTQIDATHWNVTGAAQWTRPVVIVTSAAGTFTGQVNNSTGADTGVPGNILTVKSAVVGTAIATGQTLVSGGPIIGTTVGAQINSTQWHVSPSQYLPEACCGIGWPITTSAGGYYEHVLISNGAGGVGDILTLSGNHTGPNIATGQTISGGTNNIENTLDDQNAFRFECIFSHFNFDDPVTAPGVLNGNAHGHVFVGNLGTRFDSTYASLQAPGTGSTCPGGPLNDTGYWFPVLVDPVLNKYVAMEQVEFYYKANRNEAYNPPSATLPVRRISLPRGLHYIFGYDVHNKVRRESFTWECIDITTPAGVSSLTLSAGGSGYDGGGTATFTNVALNGGAGTGATADFTVTAGVVTAITINNPGLSYNANDTFTVTAANLGGGGSGFSATAPGVGSQFETLTQLWNWLSDQGKQTNGVDCQIIRARGDAGSFWNGQLDSPDHFTHLLGAPDATHQVEIPFFSALVDYNRGTDNFGNWYLTSDRQDPNPANWLPNGFSMHADWFGGWHPAIMDYFQTNSLEIGSVYNAPGTNAGYYQHQNNSGGNMSSGQANQIGFGGAALALSYLGGTTGGGGAPVTKGEAYFNSTAHNKYQIPSRNSFITPDWGCRAADNFILRTSLTGADATLVAQFICNLVTHNLITDGDPTNTSAHWNDGKLGRWQSCGPKFDYIGLFIVGANANETLLNLCGWLMTATVAGSPTWTNHQGWTGTDATTATNYIDLNWAGLNATFLNAISDHSHMSVWSLTSAQAVNGGSAIGFNNGGGDFSYIAPRTPTNTGTMMQQQAAGPALTFSNTDGSGFYLVQRSASNNTDGYQSNGSGLSHVISSPAASSATRIINKIAVLARWDQTAGSFPGSAVSGFGGTVALVTVGKDLSLTDIQNLCHDENVLVTGANGAPGVC